MRYTAVFETDAYSANVQRIIETLLSSGHTTVKLKNYWRRSAADSVDYMGINGIFQTGSGNGSGKGFVYELQFHTPQTITTKERKAHLTYEKFRKENNAAHKGQYWEEMCALWSVVPVPHAVLEIGHCAVKSAAPSTDDESELEFMVSLCLFV